jgi:hypothetical protein
MGITYKVNIGIPDLQRKLGEIDKYDADTQAKLRTVVQTSTSHIRIGAMRRVSVKSGHLFKNISITYDATKNEGIVKAKSPHAHLVEFGAKGAVERPSKRKALHGGSMGGYFKKVNIPARKEHPFMRPSFEDEKPNLIRNSEAAIKP